MPLSLRWIVVEVADELATQRPHVVDVLLDRLGRQIRRCQVLQKRTEQPQKLLTGWQVFLQAHPRAWPAVQIAAVVFESMACCRGGVVYLGSFRRCRLPL